MATSFLTSLLCLLTLGSISCFAAENTTKPDCYSPGDTVCSSNDTYTIHKKLGEGAFGEVYSVQNSIGQQLALKTYKQNDWKHYFMDANREFLLGQLLDHPNIIKSLELFTSKPSNEIEVSNLILELVQGKILCWTESGSLSVENAANYMIHLCEALQYAYSLGLFHMDLHCANIMITKNMSDIKIIDLASFSTFKEIMPLLYVVLPQSSIKSLNPLLNSPQIVKPQIQKFILENPQLLNKILKDEDIVGTILQQKNKLMDLNLSVSPLLQEKLKNKFRKVISQFYFDKITEICIQVLRKSTLEKDEKIILRIEIKKLAWEYEEDIEEDHSLPLEQYIDNLIKLLQIFKENKTSLKSAA